jgi:hypothetical protein
MAASFPVAVKSWGARPSFSCAEGASPKVSGGSHRSGGSPFPCGSLEIAAKIGKKAVAKAKNRGRERKKTLNL